jgi:hypothetical protein
VGSEEKVTLNIEDSKQRRITTFCIVSVLKIFLPGARHIGQPFVIACLTKAKIGFGWFASWEFLYFNTQEPAMTLERYGMMRGVK